MKPFVIVFGHEKGGTGKSTLCTNVVLALMYANNNNTVAILDTDSRQATTYNFFIERAKNHKLCCPDFDIIYPSDNDSKQYSEQEDIAALTAFVAKNSHKDYIVIDTAGSYNNLSVHSLDFAHLLITPISDSILDINALITTTSQGTALMRGPYAETVFNQRKQRILTQNRTPLKWFLVRNRIAAIPQENTAQCAKIIQHISKNINAELVAEIKDRSAMKDMFSLGLSVMDLPKLTQDISKTKLNAFTEIVNLTQKIIQASKYI